MSERAGGSGDVKPHMWKGPGGRLLEHCTVGIDTFLYSTLTSVWIFPIAFLLTLQFFHPGFESKTLRIVGKGIVVLQLYYCEFFGFGAEPNLANPYGFFSSCLYLFFDEVVVKHFMRLHRESFKASMSWSVPTCYRNLFKTNPEVQSHYEFFKEHIHDKKDDVAWNVYMDLRKPLRKAVITWIVQSGLFMYYLWELNGDSQEEDSPGTDAQFPKNVSMVKYMLALFLLDIARHEHAGPGFGTAFWKDKMRKVTRSKDNPHSMWKLVFRLCSLFCDNEDGDTACYVNMPPSVHIFIRMFFDFFVNGMARSIIIGSAPIMLCVEGPLDFVKDATAVFFIIRLDEIEPTIALREREAWNPLSTETSYDLKLINDVGYTVDGLRKLLHFPSLDDVHQDAKKMLLEADEKAEAKAEEKAEEKEANGGYQPPQAPQQAWLQPWTPSFQHTTV